METEEIKSTVRKYITEHIFNKQSLITFTDDSPLISGRLMDSIVTLKMITHLEDLLRIEFKAHEVTATNLDSVNIITDFLLRKLNK